MRRPHPNKVRKPLNFKQQLKSSSGLGFWNSIHTMAFMYHELNFHVTLPTIRIQLGFLPLLKDS